MRSAGPFGPAGCAAPCGNRNGNAVAIKRATRLFDQDLAPNKEGMSESALSLAFASQSGTGNGALGSLEAVREHPLRVSFDASADDQRKWLRPIWNIVGADGDDYRASYGRRNRHLLQGVQTIGAAAGG